MVPNDCERVGGEMKRRLVKESPLCKECFGGHDDAAELVEFYSILLLNLKGTLSSA